MKKFQKLTDTYPMELIFLVLLLGILQGATEFLPISSSGHLAIVENLPFIAQQISILEKEFSLLYFNVMLHFGTILSVLVYMAKDVWGIVQNFFSDLMKKNFSGKGWHVGWLIFFGSAPLLLVPLYKEYVEQSIKSTIVIGIFFLVNAILLITAEILFRFRSRYKNPKLIYEMKHYQAFLIGIFQCIAVFPGISRSGSTIVGALLQRFSGIDSVRFSFLLSIPALLGATAFELKEALEITGGFSNMRLDLLTVGIVSAFISGLLSIRILGWLGRKTLFYPFGIYTALLGIAILLWLGN